LLSPQLRNVNVSVSAGELLAVVGPVGSGKSTLLNACIGELNVQQVSSIGRYHSKAADPVRSWRVELVCV
jgi:ABC-type lipoprotein export system ATPase subunit